MWEIGEEKWINKNSDNTKFPIWKLSIFSTHIYFKHFENDIYGQLMIEDGHILFFNMINHCLRDRMDHRKQADIIVLWSCYIQILSCFNFSLIHFHFLTFVFFLICGIIFPKTLCFFFFCICVHTLCASSMCCNHGIIA